METDSFTVPEPSEPARQAFAKATATPNLYPEDAKGIRAAYDVDFPAMAFAEVARALQHFEIDSYDYLSVRFPGVIKAKYGN